MGRIGVEARAELGLGRTVARLLHESGKRQVDRRKWTSFDKAKIIADFFGMTMDQLWAEHLFDMQESGVELSDDDKIALEQYRIPFRFVEAAAPADAAFASASLEPSVYKTPYPEHIGFK